MKLCVIYHPNGEFARIVEEFAGNMERQRGVLVELISLSTREGAAMASLYDVMTYPAILALQDNGTLLKYWEGEKLPLINEVVGYAYA